MFKIFEVPFNAYNDDDDDDDAKFSHIFDVNIHFLESWRRTRGCRKQIAAIIMSYPRYQRMMRKCERGFTAKCDHSKKMSTNIQF